MKRSASIITHDLTTGYHTQKGEKVISRDINESIYSGELTCLLGSNGAGKSTLLKTLSAFLPPLGGSLEIEGKDLSAYSDIELAKVIGVVLTDRINIDNMSVGELVAMGRSPYTGFWGRLGKEDQKIVEHAMEFMKITDFRDRMVQSLSDGERQKVMIAKALAQSTPIIFLDEPTAFLDYPSKVEIMQQLHNLSREEGKTVFMSTHDLELALQISDKIWLLDKNIGVETGTPEDLSLSGDLDRFFKREGIEFDREEGLFRISHKIRGEMKVFGTDSGRVNMVAKALLRNGIKADREVESPHSVEVVPDGYVFNGQKAKSIKELLDLIMDASAV